MLILPENNKKKKSLNGGFCLPAQFSILTEMDRVRGRVTPDTPPKKRKTEKEKNKYASRFNTAWTETFPWVTASISLSSVVNRTMYWLSKKQHYQNKVPSSGLKHEARNYDHLYAHLAKEPCSLGRYTDEKVWVNLLRFWSDALFLIVSQREICSLQLHICQILHRLTEGALVRSWGRHDTHPLRDLLNLKKHIIPWLLFL